MLRVIGESIRGLPMAAEAAMKGSNDSDQAAGGAEEGQQRVSGARERARLAKRRELAAHERAIQRHEQAAQVQERFGHPDRAATAREHAQHARELLQLALREQQEWEGPSYRTQLIAEAGGSSGNRAGQ
jgi:hypothetical protein